MRRELSAQAGLCARLSRAGSRAGVSGALLADDEAGRLVRCESDFVWMFADGSAAVIVTGDELNANGPEIVATKSIFYPDTEEMMGWKVSEKGFRITLSPQVPVLIRENLGRDMDVFLSEQGHKRSDIGSWVLHTGGPKVLEATAAALELNNGQLDASWDCLKKVGNLSLASVLVVLEDVMRNRRPEPGTFRHFAAM